MTNKEVIISALQNKDIIELTKFIENVLEYFSGKCPPRTVEELIECEKRGDERGGVCGLARHNVLRPNTRGR